jgi:hypothetical protein
MRRFLAPMTVLMLLGASLVQAEDEPAGILDKAIKAHGGKEKLSRLRPERSKMKVEVYVANSKGGYDAEVTLALPDKRLIDITQNLPGNQKMKVFTCIDGDKAWQSLSGKVMDLGEAQRNSMKQDLYVTRLTRLTPLVTDKNFTLKSLGEATVKIPADDKTEDHAVVGIRVSSPGHKDVELFFDKESHLLLKSRYQGSFQGKEVTEEEYYTDFKDADGCKRPMKIFNTRDGQKWRKMEITEVKYLDSVPEKLFAKPS